MELRKLGVTQHVAQNSYVKDKARRRSAIEQRTTRYRGYAVSQCVRKRIEEVVGSAKSAGGLHQVRHRRLNRVGVYIDPRSDGLQLSAVAQTDRRRGMSDPAHCEVVRSWRITGSDMWDQDVLDLAKPAPFTLDNAGHGEVEFGAAHLDLSVDYGRQIVFFRFAGFAEGDQMRGDGTAQIADNGTLGIVLHFVDGDEPTLTAQRETASVAC